MKSIIVLLVSLAVLVGCGGGGERGEAQPEETGDVAAKEASGSAELSEQDALNKPDPTGAYGEPISLSEATGISALLADPAPYQGKKVLVEGTIADVCPRRGCWIDLTDTETAASIRVKVVDGVIVFPLSGKGRKASVEGVVEKLELSEEDARAWKEHEAEERGEAFDPTSVTGPEVIWRIKGTGAEIPG